MPTPVIPNESSFFDWSAQIGPTLKKMTVPLPAEEGEWMQWACAVIDLNSEIAGFIPYPTELAYPEPSDWRQWASYFIQFAS